MKKLIFMLLIISSYSSKAQLTIDETKNSYPVVGFSTGYSLTHSVLNAGLQFGYKADLLYLSGDMIIPLTSSAFVPKIFTVNLGVNVSQFQPFISTSYQSIGAESELYYKGTDNEFMSGFRFGYGIRYYPLFIPICFNIQRQGKEFITSLTIYKAL